MDGWPEWSEPERTSDPLIGLTIDGYRLVRLLGRGGTSRVYLAHETGLAEQAREREGTHEQTAAADLAAHVAIKMLMLPFDIPASTRARFQMRFLREAQAARRLRHPHLLPVLRAGEANDQLYMVMPALFGGTLSTRLKAAAQPLPFAEIASYIKQVAEALDYVHAQGVVHRDVKPSNILLDENGWVYLSDFGIAHLLIPSRAAQPSSPAYQPPTLTTSGQLLGTPHYMAPEQITGAPVGPETDVYALGVVLYQLVTGQVPYDGDSPFEIAAQHLQSHPQAPHSLRPDLCTAAQTAILRALAKRPAERFESAGRLAQAFAEALSCDEVLDGVGPHEVDTQVVVPPSPGPVSQDPTLPDAFDRVAPFLPRSGAGNAVHPRRSAFLRQRGVPLARVGKTVSFALALVVLVILIQHGLLAGLLSRTTGEANVPPATTLATPSPTSPASPLSTAVPTPISTPTTTISWQGSYVFARRSATGQLLWTFWTDKPIIAPPQIKGGVVYVTDQEHIYLLRLSDGALLARADNGGDH
ncbi:MAG TPA: protein kinase [Ktedonobacterales bacterium]|nr:protein kinase [Ktedonobacterales bacterium]